MNTHYTSRGRQQEANARHLDQHDLAARWRMSVRTLERWRSQRQGPPFLKLGGRIVYALSDVEAFEQARRQETSTA
jgi:hypothetical protein